MISIIQQINWILGPAVLASTTVIYDHFRASGDLPATTILLIPLLVLAGFLGGSARWPQGGLYAALLSAAWIAGYSIWLGGGMERRVFVPAGVFAIAVLVGWLRLRAWQGEALEHEAGELALGANIHRLAALEKLVRDLYQEWDDLPDIERKKRVGWIWDRCNGIGTLAAGWRQIGKHQYWAKRGGE